MLPTDPLLALLFQVVTEKIYRPIKNEPDEKVLPGCGAPELGDPGHQTEEIKNSYRDTNF